MSDHYGGIPDEALDSTWRDVDLVRLSQNIVSWEELALGLTPPLHIVFLSSHSLTPPDHPVTEDMCVTHFLIQPHPEGVMLQGWNERTFSEEGGREGREGGREEGMKKTSPSSPSSPPSSLPRESAIVYSATHSGETLPPLPPGPP